MKTNTLKLRFYYLIYKKAFFHNKVTNAIPIFIQGIVGWCDGFTLERVHPSFCCIHKLFRFEKITLSLSEIQEASHLDFARSMAYT